MDGENGRTAYCLYHGFLDSIGKKRDISIRNSHLRRSPVHRACSSDLRRRTGDESGLTHHRSWGPLSRVKYLSECRGRCDFAWNKSSYAHQYTKTTESVHQCVCAAKTLTMMPYDVVGVIVVQSRRPSKMYVQRFCALIMCLKYCNLNSGYQFSARSRSSRIRWVYVFRPTDSQRTSVQHVISKASRWSMSFALRVHDSLPLNVTAAILVSLSNLILISLPV